VSIVCAAELAIAERTVQVGVYQNKPKIFTDKNGHTTGLFIDLLEEIAKKEGWILSYRHCKWDDCLVELEQGQIDILPDVAYSPERDKIYDFHRVPVAESYSRIYAGLMSSFDKISDLSGKRVAVNGSIQQKEFEQTMRGYNYYARIAPTASFEEAFQMVSEGLVDAAIANHFFGDYFHQSYNLVKTPIVFNAVSLYYATDQGKNSDILETIDRYLEKSQKEPSVYYAILSHWTKQAVVFRTPQYIFWIIAVISGSVFFCMGHYFSFEAANQFENTASCKDK
jgi:ABC-type amino acid transport substrate-binding protein